MYRRLLFVCVLSLSFLHGFSQTIEQAYRLKFRSEFDFQSEGLTCTIPVTSEGIQPSRIGFKNKDSFWFTPSKENCSLYWSRTVVLPVNAGKKECSITLNCKSDVDSLRFVVIALDKKDNDLYTDSVIIPPAAPMADYSLKFRKKEVRAVKIIIRYDGNREANEGLFVYLNRITIRVGNQELNNLPINSLEYGNTRLNPQAIIPLSLENDASLSNIQDWKDKKIIALGASIPGIQDILDAQIQTIKYLITSENCKLIFLELPQEMCLRWNLYLQGKSSKINEDKLRKEVKTYLNNPTVFFEFLQWVKRYNVKVPYPVRIVGLMNYGGDDQLVYLTDYLLNFSTSRQDSVYYLNAVNQRKFSDLKEYILQSQLHETLNKEDFQCILFLLDEWDNRTQRTLKGMLGRDFDNVLDQTKCVVRTLDIYCEKAIVLAPSERINKRFPLCDIKESASRITFNRLGSYLYQYYGKQYYAVSFQIGERSCRMDSSQVGRYPTDWNPPFPFTFEQTALDSKIPYFYCPSNQLPDAIGGLNLFPEFMPFLHPGHPISFCYCHIPSHFDALIFIKESKAIRDNVIHFFLEWRDYARNNVLNIDELLKKLRE